MERQEARAGRLAPTAAEPHTTPDESRERALWLSNDSFTHPVEP